MSDDVKMFEGSQIRSVWDNEREEWYFSVVDVIGSLTESNNPRDYWYRVKKRMSDEERSELSTICRQLKLKASDGKMRLTDVADMQGIFSFPYIVYYFVFLISTVAISFGILAPSPPWNVL